MAKKLYPGIVEAERERLHTVEDEEPDFIGDAPNYEKFQNWTPEQVMVWLNID